MKKGFIILPFLVFIWFHSFVGFGQVRENQLKSVLVERFSRFVDWPEKKTDSIFIINVLGNKEMYRTLKETYASRQINAHPVQVNFNAYEEQPGECHVLYVGDCYNEKITPLIETFLEQETLIIGDNAACHNYGATLSFINKNNKIVFNYNEAALNRTKVKISYKLLELAKNY